jgi:hypothetical protein
MTGLATEHRSGGSPFDRDHETALTTICELTKGAIAKIDTKCSKFSIHGGWKTMLKTLAVIGALAVTAPGLALAADPQPTQPQPQGNAGTTQTGPSGPGTLFVVVPGVTNNPNGLPTMPDVFNGGQPTGGSPNPNGVDHGAASP